MRYNFPSHVKDEYLEYLMHRNIPFKLRNSLEIKTGMPLAAKSLRRVCDSINLSFRLMAGSPVAVHSHGESYANKIGVLGGWTTSPLTKKGIQSAPKSVSTFFFSSDIPRALHYSLAMCVPEKLDQIPKEVCETEPEDIYSEKVYETMMKLALENNIIPTPLLRSQHYGGIDYQEERPISDLKATDERFKKTGFTSMRPATLVRTNQNFKHFDLEYYPLMENRLDLYDRFCLFFLVLKRFFHYNFSTMDEKDELYSAQGFEYDKAPMDIVTHSGVLDCLHSYFVNRDEHERFILEKRPKDETRGRVMNIHSQAVFPE